MNALRGATPFEKEVIEHILKKESPDFLVHLPILVVEKRENTGIGIYVYFKYSEEPPTKLSVRKTLGQSVYVDIEGLEGGVGFMLYIDDGRITMLECFSHSSETWPSKITKFDIQDL